MTKVIVIDPGHALWDSGSIAIDGQAEKHYTLALSLAVRDVLAAYDCRVILTRDTDTALAEAGNLGAELRNRANVANVAKADLFLSIHHDAGPPTARGGSLYIWTDKRKADGNLVWLPADGNHTAPKSYAISKAFVPAVKDELARYGIPWRGDIMCADFGVLRACDGPALLLETHFGTNEHDNWAARRPDFINDLANRIAMGLAEALELLPNVIEPSADVAVSIQGTPILGASIATIQQAMAWARDRGATERFFHAAYLYWYYGWLTGLRSDAMYSQSAKETAFGNHGGVLTAAFNNFAGIKVAAGGDNYDKLAHERFATVEDGVRAHFNHMSSYVGLAPIGTPHGRYHIVKALPWAGSIRTVEELGAKWAPNPDYGSSIVRDYLDPMIAKG